MQNSTLALPDYFFIMALGDECLSLCENFSELLSIACSLPFDFSNNCYKKAKNLILKEIAGDKSNLQ